MIEPDFDPGVDPDRWISDWDSGLGQMASMEVTVTDNPVVSELYGPDGSVIRQWRERKSIGYRKR